MGNTSTQQIQDDYQTRFKGDTNLPKLNSIQLNIKKHLDNQMNILNKGERNISFRSAKNLDVNQQNEEIQTLKTEISQIPLKRHSII